MNSENIFHRRSQLLVDILPFINEESCFALKGGTAINYFVQDMPRYSVDIDLVFLPILPREQTLTAIKQTIHRIADNIHRHLPLVKVAIDNSKDVVLPKLIARKAELEVIVEVNPIVRGTVYTPEMKMLTPKAQGEFQTFVTMPIASIADLYGGKFCAALARQHPRDLFDVKYLFDHQGLTDEIRHAFVIYLASDKRPLNELLTPNVKPYAIQAQLFDKEFHGMTTIDVTFQELADMVEQLSQQLRAQFTPNEKQFLLSLAAGEPEWDKLALPHVQGLPAVQWKLMNIRKMSAEKRDTAFNLLAQALDGNAQINVKKNHAPSRQRSTIKPDIGDHPKPGDL